MEGQPQITRMRADCTRRSQNGGFITRLLMLLIITASFGALLGCKPGGSENRFKSEAEYTENRVQQLAMTPKILAQLRQHGVTDESELSVEYFFHTDMLEKASQLAGKLTSLGYTSGSGHSAKDKKLVVVTGKTIPMKMDDKTVLDWTDRMCDLGRQFDCEFAGWGVNPKQ